MGCAHRYMVIPSVKPFKSLANLSGKPNHPIENPITEMKITTSRLILASAGILAAAALTSCVDPYGQSTVSASVTTYRPGYEVRTLPSGYRVETIGGSRYYLHNGTYYQSRSGRYVVVAAPRGGNRQRDVYIQSLPRGYRVEPYHGRNYYRVNSTYYERRGSGYVVVNRPY